MKEKLENLVKRLRVLARGIARGNCDPDDLVHGFVEYYLKNEEKLMDHPNLIAFAVWKMKNLYIDELRKSKNLTSLTDQEGKDMEIIDDKQPDMYEKMELKSKSKKVLNIIKGMGEKCQQILILTCVFLLISKYIKLFFLLLLQVMGILYSIQWKLLL